MGQLEQPTIVRSSHQTVRFLRNHPLYAAYGRSCAESIRSITFFLELYQQSQLSGLYAAWEIFVLWSDQEPWGLAAVMPTGNEVGASMRAMGQGAPIQDESRVNCRKVP